MEAQNAVQSISRKANCFDKAMIEDYSGQLNTEMFLDETFNTVNELIRSIEEYIDWCHNELI